MFEALGNPAFGYTPLADAAGKNREMLMDAGYVLLGEGQRHDFFSEESETALLLLAGRVEFHWCGNSAAASRPNSFDCLPHCLHMPRGVRAAVVAQSGAELLVVQTENRLDFQPRLYSPTDGTTVRAGAEELHGCALRDIRTVFDVASAPHSNLVVGEVVTHPGRWSSYPPHHHPQPELYFFRFDRPQGFGACFIGDQAYKTKHLSYAAIPGGIAHPQAAAPGYAMHYVWVIRHLPGNPWAATRTGYPAHDWMLTEGVKIRQPGPNQEETA